MEDNQQITASSEPKVKIIGLGGAGANVLGQISHTALGLLPLALVHTHARLLQQHPAIPERLLIGANRTHGLGTGGDADLARVMAEAEEASLASLVGGADLVFLVAGLGGGTGTGVTPVLARAAKQAGALVIAVAATPFAFEGPRRQKQALAGLPPLRAAADAVICLPNQKMCKLLDGKTTIVEAFSRTNDLLGKGLLGIWQMLSRPGLINVDFAYLRSILRGRHTESLLAMAEARGENRAREVIEQLLANPLLDQGEALAEADQVLVSLTGSENFLISEITRIMEELKRHGDRAEWIVGTAVDPSLGDAISVTLIASKNGKSAAPAGEDAASAPRQAVSIASSPLLAHDAGFMDEDSTPRPAPRFVAPPPESTPERTRELMDKAPGSRLRKAAKWKQEMLALEIVSRGRFEKSEPTVHRGADLDVPTYVRRGMPLN